MSKVTGGDMKMYNFNKSLLKGAVNPIDFVISVVIVVIVVAAVAIPTIQDVLTDANITGIPATILSVIPTFLGLLVLVLIARGM